MLASQNKRIITTAGRWYDIPAFRATPQSGADFAPYAGNSIGIEFSDSSVLDDETGCTACAVGKDDRARLGEVTKRCSECGQEVRREVNLGPATKLTVRAASARDVPHGFRGPVAGLVGRGGEESCGARYESEVTGIGVNPA